MGVIEADYDVFRACTSPLRVTAPSILASVTEAVIPANPVHVLDLGISLPAIIITSVSLWRRKALGYAFAVPLLVFITLTGSGILIMDSLVSTAGAFVSSGQEAFVAALVAVSLVLSWLYLRVVKDTVIPSDVVGTLQRSSSVKNQPSGFSSLLQ